ncbi:MAG: polymerase [Steroidobacteraceae bacterium]|jgi:DNA polymerase-1|nr:polymerase [Steroidobacteraceae bacterium]
MSMASRPDLVLVDGSSYLYRAFHALPPFSNSRGEPTGAVFGVLNMLNKFLKDYDPERIAVVFDAPGKTFRDELFTEYKAHRPPMPDDLRSQIQPLFDAVNGLGLPILRESGVEADDVIGTLACEAAKQGLSVLISTGDKDMAQLVSPKITLINTMSNTLLDRDGVKNKFDVFPEQIIDYLALVGDSSDNIPGIDKVGPKTAAKWLGQYQTLDSLVANAANVSGKVGENLRAGLATLELARKLATIRTDVTLPVTIDGLKRRAPDVAALRELYSRLELRSLLKQLEGSDPATPADTPASGTPPARPAPAAPTIDGAARAVAAAPRMYDTITTGAELDAWLKKLESASLFAFDTETTSLEYMQAEIVGVSFAVSPGVAAYLPLRHDYAGAPDQLDRDASLAKLKPLLESEQHAKVGHHLKYDAHVLANHGIRLRGMRFDSMLESYVWNSTTIRHDMDSAAEKYLGIRTIHYEDVAGKGAKQIPFSQVPVDKASEYSAEDSDVTLRLHEVLWPLIQSVPALKTLYEDIEQPLVPVLARMEEHGVLLDRQMLRAQGSELGKRLMELLGEAHQEAGTPFNLDSPKQLGNILFEKMQLPVLRKTPTGQPSTAEDVLEELAESYRLPKLILEHRNLSKLKSTYTDKLPEQINARTGRVHTSYHQAVAATGRLSSQDPNLQNIPIRTPEGRRIRQAFIAPEGHVLLAADYSQIELRIMAHLSGDEGLLNAFASDQDIHQATASEVFSTPLDQVTADQRRSAKAVNFGLIYGMSAFGLAAQLGIARGTAQEYIDLYFARYPGVKRYMEETRASARERGYVETVFGRRLYLPDINARNKQFAQAAERAAINAPMQGTAADIIKRAMISVDRLCAAGAGAQLIMQVHDELVLEVRADRVAEVTGMVREKMMGAADLRVPLKVDVGTGSNWDEAH